jgi:hypothetical protein
VDKLAFNLFGLLLLVAGTSPLWWPIAFMYYHVKKNKSLTGRGIIEFTIWQLMAMGGVVMVAYFSAIAHQFP